MDHQVVFIPSSHEDNVAISISASIVFIFPIGISESIVFRLRGRCLRLNTWLTPTIVTNSISESIVFLLVRLHGLYVFDFIVKLGLTPVIVTISISEAIVFLLVGLHGSYVFDFIVKLGLIHLLVTGAE